MKTNYKIVSLLTLTFCLMASFGSCKNNKKELTKKSTADSVVSKAKPIENKIKPVENKPQLVKSDTLPKKKETLYVHCQLDTIKGIDVSHFQGNVDWQKVRNHGLHFGIVKATQGKHYVDRKFKTNWKNIAKAELVRGAYHFFSPNTDPIEQADHYLKVIGNLGRYDLAPFLDLEGEDIGKLTIEEYQTNVKKWMHYVEKKCGKRPIIYTNYLFANKYLNDSRFSEHKLWLAEYRSHHIVLPKVWKQESWVGWQFTEKGVTPGVKGKVDESHFLSKFIYKGKIE